MASTLMTLRHATVTDIAYIQKGELLQKIAEVRKDVGGVKLAQGNKIKKMKDEVKNGLKNQIAETLG